MISGRVQGVFFRAETAERARGLDLAGSVRNRPDGSVEACFEGPSDEVDDMVEWCRRGPPLARVDHVEIEELTPTGESGFAVTR